jgi:hypothetical protein
LRIWGGLSKFFWRANLISEKSCFSHFLYMSI